MSLKYEVTEVPAGFENVYTQTESGTFRLQVEGVVPESVYEAVKAEKNKFRDNNTNLLKTNTALSSVAELVGGVQNVSPEILQQRIDSLAAKSAEGMAGAMKTKYELELTQARESLAQSNGRLSQMLLSDQVQKSGLGQIEETAYDDVMHRAATKFEVVDGNVVFKGQELDANGNAFTVQSWMADLATKAPHLFKKSQGTGASRNAKNVANVNQVDRSSHDLLSSGLTQLSKPATKRLT